MDILFVSVEDINGGAARAAYRIYKSLQNSGIKCKMLVQNKTSDDFTVIGPETIFRKAFGRIRPLLDSIPVKKYKNRSQTAFSTSYFPFSDVSKKINALNPDIVHLHYCDTMFRIEDLKRIKAPIVYHLHDMWPFTGGCHYDEGCELYASNCGFCRVLGSYKKNDLSTYVFKRKQKIYSDLKNLTIVGSSSWITDCARKSALFCRKRIINLPTPIDSKQFAPIEKNIARSILSLPPDKKLILFGAVGATSDPRKGFKELSMALDKINIKDLEIIIFGGNQLQSPIEMKYKTHYMGVLHDSTSLRILYNAADLTIVPSLQENLSNVILESLSTGTPVVGFNIGGNSDMVEHEKNGYLAKPFDPEDLAYGIEWILKSKNYNDLCENAIIKIQKEFDYKIVASKYVKLYDSILDSKAP